MMNLEHDHISKAGRAKGLPNRRIANRFEVALRSALSSRGVMGHAIIFILAFALYANTLGHDFAVDDDIILRENVFVQQGISCLGKIFSNPFLIGQNGVKESYRPLPLATFALEVSLAGGNPHVHHATNVILYALLAVMIFAFLRKMLSNYDPIVPFSMALLFVVHPVHTEVVANIKGRDEILSMLLAVCSILFLLRGINAKKLWIRSASYLCYFFALLSKEHIAMFLFVIPLVLYLFARLQWRQIVLESLPFIVALSIYLWVRWSVLGVDNVGHTPPLIANSLVVAPGAIARIPMAFNILGRYLLLLLFPWRLTWDYSYNQIPYVGWDDMWTIVSIGVYGAMASYAILGIVRKDQRSFGIAYYLIAISIVSNIPILLPATMAERFLFAPSLGFCYTLGVVAEGRGRSKTGSASSRWKGRVLAIIIVICAVMSIRTITRGADWKDNLTLLTTDVLSSPNSARAHSALGATLMRIGKQLPNGDQKRNFVQKAAAEFQKSLEILPGQLDVLHDLGATCYISEDYDNLLKCYQRALEFDPNNAEVHSVLGATYLKLAKKLLTADQHKEMLQKAVIHFRKSNEINPAQWETWQNLGNAYYAAGDYDEAINCYQRALEQDPQKSPTHNSIGALAFARREYKRAIECFKMAVQLDSSSAEAYGNLGAVYHKIGDRANALICYKRALQMDPQLGNVRANVELLENTSMR